MADDYFYPPDETLSFQIKLVVKPEPPADEAKAVVRKRGPDGPVHETKAIAKDGSASVQIPLKGLTVDDSPVAITFSARKGDYPPREVTRLASLARAVPGAVEGPAKAGVGSKAPVKVSKWIARCYDLPDTPTPREEKDLGRIPNGTRKKVKWRLAWTPRPEPAKTSDGSKSDDSSGARKDDGGAPPEPTTKDLKETGDSVSFDVEEDMHQEVEVTAYLDDMDPEKDGVRTRVTIVPDAHVLSLTLKAHSADGGDVPLGGETVDVVNRDTKKVVATEVADDDGVVTVIVSDVDPDWKPGTEYDLKVHSEHHATHEPSAEGEHAYLNFLVLDAEGEPYADKPVTLEGRDGAFDARTGPDGEVELHAEPGAYDVKIGDETFKVHTLFPDDVDEEHDGPPYTLFLAPKKDHDPAPASDDEERVVERDEHELEDADLEN